MVEIVDPNLKGHIRRFRRQYKRHVNTGANYRLDFMKHNDDAVKVHSHYNHWAVMLDIAAAYIDRKTIVGISPDEFLIKAYALCYASK